MGKVHGSLARAGKVKSQTPKVHLHLSSQLNIEQTLPSFIQKSARTYVDILCQLTQVEPQEKKKTPKGRAKKRITYTRRFVNVTMTGGKRKVR